MQKQELSTYMTKVLSDDQAYQSQHIPFRQIMRETEGYDKISSMYDMVDVENALQGMRDYLYSSGMRIGRADPESLTEMMGTTIMQLDAKNPNTVTLVTPRERQLLNTFGRSAQSGDTSIIKRNLANLQKMPSGS